jgi:hypothetical protein
MEVERNGEVIAVEGPVGLPTIMVKKIVPLENADQEKVALRKAWLKD